MKEAATHPRRQRVRGQQVRGNRSQSATDSASAMEQRQALVSEVASQREAFLQACWAHQHWNTRPLMTRVGQSMEVITPGWLNRGPGPDFTEARLIIGGTEHWGDVEVHTEEQDWWGHRHDRDERFGRVILHVMLRRGGRPAVRPVTGEPIPVLELGPFLPDNVLDVMGDPEAMLRNYENLPGRCGLRAVLAGTEALGRVVAHASETRARVKAERLLPALEACGSRDGAQEQVLYEQVFHYLGYRPHAELFLALARRFPLSTLHPLLDRPLDQARDEVLARWFGAAGLLQNPAPGDGNVQAQAEYHRLRERWLALGMDPLPVPAHRVGSRPWNAPERRMVGLFHHLRATGTGGWLKAWLGILRRLDELRDDPHFRNEAVASVERAFGTPMDEPWRRWYRYDLPPARNPARLIGTDRVTMLVANAVLPFFLTQARQHKDEELEKVLYRLYLILPAEAPNQRTRFMERRLSALVPLRPSLRSHQGLLQIYQDFCTSFHEGCAQCGFPDLVAPRRKERPG